MSTPTNATEVRAKKVNVLVDATVEAEMYLPGWMTRTVEEKAKALRAACEEFMEHCRDHRSLDRISLTVNRVVEDQCSECHAEWETMDDEGKTCCANCGVEVSHV